MAPYNTTLYLQNALFVDVLTNFNAGSASTCHGENLTVDRADRLNAGNYLTLNLTNSLLVNVTNTGTYSGSCNVA